MHLLMEKSKKRHGKSIALLLSLIFYHLSFTCARLKYSVLDNNRMLTIQINKKVLFITNMWLYDIINV